MTQFSATQRTFRRNGVAYGIARVLAGGMAALALAPVALAEDADGNAEVATAQAQQLDTIVVTAQKRSERLQDVPMSIQVVDPQKLAATGQVKLADFFSEVPGVGYVQSQMSGAITLRGIGTEVGLGTSPTTATTIDDVPFGSASNASLFPDLDPSDLSQIEVLRGPQGTLYGASSMGGLIKYGMTDPGTSGFFGHAEAGYSTVDNGGDGYSGRAAINLPVSDNFALRVSAFQRQDPDFVYNTNNDQDNSTRVRGGRISALWRVTDTLTIRSSALYQDATQDASTVVDTYYNLQSVYGDGKQDRAAGTDGYDSTLRFYTTKITQDFGWATLDSITGYSQSRQTATQDVGYTSIGAPAAYFASSVFGLGYADPSAMLDNQYDVNKFTQELRLTSPDDVRWQWQVGAFYTKEDTDSTQNFYINDRTTGERFTAYPLMLTSSASIYRARALFANSTFKFTDRFDLQVGGRYAENEDSSTSPYGGLLTDTGVEYSHNEDNDFTFSVSPRYKITGDVMAYARIASGYRAGGSNGTVIEGVPSTYKSDSLVSYEVGMKGSFLDQRLNLDVDAYYIDWSDLQVEQYDVTYGSSYTTNAGKAKSQGVELSGSFIPNENWKLSANYAFTNAELTEDIPGYVEGYSAYGKSGDQLPFTAKNAASASATRYFDLANGMVVFATAKAACQGDRYMQFTQSADLPRIHLPSYTTGSVSVGVQSDQWTVTAYVNNVTNEKAYLNSIRRSSATTGTDGVIYGSTLLQPRTVGVNLAWDF